MRKAELDVREREADLAEKRYNGKPKIIRANLMKNLRIEITLVYETVNSFLA